MAELPDTRLSLILRLPTAGGGHIDQSAWREFAEIYEPFLFRYARRRGLQDTDAHEHVQRVMIAVAKHVRHWQPSDNQRSDRPRFRNWLFTIARTQLIDVLRNSAKQAGVGGTTQLRKLQSTLAPTEAVKQDVRYEAFLWATARVKQQLAPHTWQAFWSTAVEGDSCARVAQRLKLSIGTVYAARSRVLRRLKSEIALLADDEVNS